MKLNEIIAPATAAVGYGLDIATTNWRYGKQREQQRKLTADQLAASKDMAKYQHELAYDMWQKTNFSAQRAELEKAGLNPALMYAKGAGAGGQTVSSSGGAQGGIAGTPETGMGLQLAQTASQIELTKAQARLANVEAAKKAGVETREAEANIKNIEQNTANAAITNEILSYNKEMSKIQSEIAKETKDNIIWNSANAMFKLMGEAESARAKGKLDSATVETQITIARQTTTINTLKMLQMKGEINLNEKQIAKIGAEIANMKEQRLQEWTKLTTQQKEAWIKEQIMEFNTGDMAELERSVRIGAEALEAITDMKTLFKGKKSVRHTERVDKDGEVTSTYETQTFK
nr:MAG: DNA pilot protein [Microvirus sp.]